MDEKKNLERGFSFGDILKVIDLLQSFSAKIDIFMAKIEEAINLMNAQKKPEEGTNPEEIK